MKAKPKKRHSVILMAAILSVGAAFLMMFFKLQIDIKERKNQEAIVQNEYEQLCDENERMRKYINEADEAKIIEHYARNNLDYVYPDEHLYYDVTPGS